MFVIGTMGSGGAERQVLEYLRHLDRQRFEPYLYLARRTGELLPEIPKDVVVESFWDEFPRWKARLCWVMGTTRVMRWRHLARKLRQHRINVLYDRTFLATLDTGPATWWRRTPRISTIVADPRIQMDLYFPRRQWLWRRFASHVYRAADIVLANSAGLREQVVTDFQLPPEHVRVVPNVLNLAKIDELAQQSSPSDAGRFRILTVGRIDQHKGHRDLLEAIRKLVQEQEQSKVVWQILGDGPERQSLLDEAQRLHLSEHIDWKGIVPNPYPYYRTADVFCLPSLTEGSPNVLIEALALGTPVISTDCPSGPREILEDGRWGTLVPMQCPEALAAAIADRIANPTTWQDRAAQAKPVIRERYDVNAGVKHLEELLIQVAG
jgi:glycosyltransferase involved in cell wall biosynthesis